MERIIDTHLHCWDLDKLDYYWLKNDSSILKKNYYVEDVKPEMDQLGISGAVLVQATNSLQESDWFLKLAAQYDWILGAVIWLPLQNPDEVSKLLDQYRRHPFFKGVRHQIHDEADPNWLLKDNVIESLRLLAKYDIPYDLVGIKPVHIRTALKLAETIPELRMVFDHLNQPPFKQLDSMSEWVDLMTEAGSYPNFYAKVSGLGTATKKPMHWTNTDIKNYVHFVLENFGTERVFCGGDWPVSLLAGSYGYTWQQYRNLFSELLNEEDRKLVYSMNAEKFYNL